MMTNNSKDIDKTTKLLNANMKTPLKKFAMLLFARLVFCRNLKEMLDIILLSHTVLCHRFRTPSVMSAIDRISRSIQCFPDCYKAMQDENFPEDEEITLTREDEERLHEESSQSLLWQYWESVLPTSNIEVSKGGTEENSLYCPQYFQILRKQKLPIATLWSGICKGNLDRFSTNYPTEEFPSGDGKNHLVDNMTTATACKSVFHNKKGQTHSKDIYPHFH